jgi:hypothetical protein
MTLVEKLRHLRRCERAAADPLPALVEFALDSMADMDIVGCPHCIDEPRGDHDEMCPVAALDRALDLYVNRPSRARSMMDPGDREIGLLESELERDDLSPSERKDLEREIRDIESEQQQRNEGYDRGWR